MKNRIGTCALLAAAAVLAGCASPRDNVIFVTKTSLSIVDIDGTPPSVSFAYDRVEGYLGPRFENGSVPPVIAKISSNGQVLNRDIKQYYATGTAANVLAGDNNSKPSGTELNGTTEPMFFGTATTLGIKIGFSASTPPDFTLGYRRKELSVIPIGTTKKDGKEVHHYPSVIGVFSNDVQAKTRDNSNLGLTQFFATGTAAIALADVPGMKSGFRGFATDAVGALQEAIRVQQEIVLAILSCFADVPDANIMVVAKAAKYLNLFTYASDYDDMTKAVEAKEPQKARSTYIGSLSHINADAPDRQGKLQGHFAHVCSLR